MDPGPRSLRIAVVIALTLALGSCGGGSQPADRATTTAKATPAPTRSSPPPGPRAITDAAAHLVVSRYDQAVSDAVLGADVGAVRRLQSGPVLAATLAAIREANAGVGTLEAPRPLTAPQIYVAAEVAYPQRFLAIADDAHDAGRTALSIYERRSAKDPWREVFTTEAQGHELAAPMASGGVLAGPHPDRDGQVRAAVAALSRYIATARPDPILTDTALADQDAQISKNRRMAAEREKVRLTCVPDAHPLLTIATVADDIHVFTRIHCRDVYTAAAGLSYPLRGAELVWSHGLVRARQLEYDNDIQAALAIAPDGRATLIGYDWTYSGMVIR